MESRLLNFTAVFSTSSEKVHDAPGGAGASTMAMIIRIAKSPLVGPQRLIASRSGHVLLAGLTVRFPFADMVDIIRFTIRINRNVRSTGEVGFGTETIRAIAVVSVLLAVDQWWR
jgi:hypothetical protein